MAYCKHIKRPDDVLSISLMFTCVCAIRGACALAFEVILQVPAHSVGEAALAVAVALNGVGEDPPPLGSRAGDSRVVRAREGHEGGEDGEGWEAHSEDVID